MAFLREDAERIANEVREARSKAEHAGYDSMAALALRGDLDALMSLGCSVTITPLDPQKVGSQGIVTVTVRHPDGTENATMGHFKNAVSAATTDAVRYALTSTAPKE